MGFEWLPHLSLLVTLLPLLSPTQVSAAACTTATVGSPYSNCFDIYTHAGLTLAQFNSFNPGINCSVLQIGQKVCISAGTLPSNAPGPYNNGTCFMYTTVPGDSCAAIATKFSITTANIETYNAKTYKWKGCANLQALFTMCVSPGTPPPIPVDPSLQCGPASPGNATCPLKACCSSFGFCGLTSDFCSTAGTNPCISNCFTPTLKSCSTSRTMRNIGYYAGWANRRPCGAFGRTQMNWTGYTHAHFAFATISQTFEILIADDDAPLLRDVVTQKYDVDGLKVVIAVGGWDFSEADPTKDLFSLMIAKSSTRATFISSVSSALELYDLDGIDIDFEYPGATERNAPAIDTPNLTTFFSELRAALPSAIISVAAPAGYWFLKGFEIDKIANSVTYINMMSYDYHGPWDTNVTGQASVANPHTSILDMRDSALLYVRAGIDLSKVNLGLAWYGRTYRLASSTCKGYNCTMVSGGSPGSCTDGSGYLAQFEILQLLAAGNTATFDSASQTYWFDDANGDLVTFDQSDTWKAKQNFAATTCFGGSFVWSIDQVLPSGSDSGDSNPSAGSYSIITWNPNPYPATTAKSQTFIGSGSTVVIPVPTATTEVTIGGQIITLNAGGTPIVSRVPTGVSQPGAVTPSWTYYISPPSGARSVTFTAPITAAPTYTSVVPAPTASNAPAQNVTGPPGGSTCNGVNTWKVQFGPSIVGCLPPDVGIPGGITPSAMPPDNWIGIWTNPAPPFAVSTITPPHSYTSITWNPNPYPPPTASSETFIRSGSTVVIAIPTSTTSITIGPVVITLNSGGTPVNAPVPTDVTQPSAITPTWTYNILPPPDATTVFFTAPLTSTPTYTSHVPVPTSSDSHGNPVIGPVGSKNPCDGTNVWTLLFGGLIGGCLPLDIGIVGGITPRPIAPPGWTEPFPNPYPLETGSPDDESSSQTTQTTSTTTTSTSTSPCAAWETGLYDLSDDPEDEDWDDQGTDPNDLRRRDGAQLVPRAGGRRITVAGCNTAQAKSPQFVSLSGRSTWYTVLNTGLFALTVGGRPFKAIQEHVFELGYIRQFFGSPYVSAAGCTWITDNVFNFDRVGGGTMGTALVGAIDQVSNMVWADVPMNQAKSSLVNGHSTTAAMPPQLSNMKKINQGNFNLKATTDKIMSLEYYLRNAAALGDYLDETSSTFQATALRVQNLLSEITPTTPVHPDLSLPLLFNQWLRSTVQGYPSGCTTRAQNTWNYYRNMLQTMSASSGPPIPSCFTLYHANNYHPSTIPNYEDLLPPAPSLARCNAPGTEGAIGHVTRDQSADWYMSRQLFRVMGSGDTDYFAMGTGASLSGSHLQAFSISGISQCNGAYTLVDTAPTQGALMVQIAFDCTPVNQNGDITNALTFVVNGQALSCYAIVVSTTTSSRQDIVCGHFSTIDACASSYAVVGASTSGVEAVKQLWYPGFDPR